MAWRMGEQYGDQIVCEIYQALHVDPAWVKDDQTGFRWWPSDYSQRVWCDAGVYQQATTIYRIHVETDLIKGAGRAQAFELALEREMDNTTLSGLVFDKEDDTYKLHCSIFASEENMVYLKRTLIAAVMLQLYEAQVVRQHLQSALGAVPAISTPPNGALRTRPDAMLQAAQQFFVPIGKEPCKWIGVPEWRETEHAIEREANEFKSDHETHLQAGFAWTPTDSATGIQLEVSTSELHPELGAGLHFTLTVPLQMTPEHVSHMALTLNQYERDNWKRSHMMGSWSCHQGRLAYRMFLPNTIYNRDLLPQMTINMANRAYWVNEYFTEMRREADARRQMTTQS